MLIVCAFYDILDLCFIYYWIVNVYYPNCFLQCSHLQKSILCGHLSMMLCPLCKCISTVVVTTFTYLSKCMFLQYTNFGASSGSQLELRCSSHVTHVMWHTSLSTIIYNTLILSREKVPSLPLFALLLRQCCCELLQPLHHPSIHLWAPSGVINICSSLPAYLCNHIWGSDEVGA